ncbi:MAG: hypothetical protein JWP27_566 [Flaviaesturariibacter sp.]|nr:hypothetical protein [Flaviaesturariibacter sp.]
MSTQQITRLQTKLEQLENEYAQKFTGLSNWAHLNKMWQEIKSIRNEIEQLSRRRDGTDPASS